LEVLLQGGGKLLSAVLDKRHVDWSFAVFILQLDKYLHFLQTGPVLNELFGLLNKVDTGPLTFQLKHVKISQHQQATDQCNQHCD
jgi:hypothetical protein